MGGCLGTSSSQVAPEIVNKDVIVISQEIDYVQIMGELGNTFSNRFESVSLNEIWPRSPLHEFINNHSLLTIFHKPQSRRSHKTFLAKCYDPDVVCTSTQIAIVPYRWKLNERFREEFCYEIPSNSNKFMGLRKTLDFWHDRGYSLRVMKKLPGSDKNTRQNALFPNDGHFYCALQCIFQNHDLGTDHKVLALPWSHTLGRNRFLDYEFPDIVSELGGFGRQGFRVCGMFSTIVSVPKDLRVGSQLMNVLHIVLEKMPGRRYRFKQSVYYYRKRIQGGHAEITGNIENWIHDFTMQGWVIGASMKMPSLPDQYGEKIPELLVFQTTDDSVL